MATYFLNSAAAGTGTGADWTNAFTTLTAAIAAATANGDIIKVHKAHTEELAANTTFTFTAHVNVICVDKDAADALAEMGTAAWIGNSTLSRTITIAGAKRINVRGITFRTASSSTTSMTMASTDGQHIVYVNCYFWQGSTGSLSTITFGATGAQSYAGLRDCTLRFGHAGQLLRVASKMEMFGGSVSSAGTAPSSLVTFSLANAVGCTIDLVGADLSHLAAGNLVGDSTAGPGIAKFTQCKLGSGYVILAAQTVANRSGAEGYVFDCASGDTHGLFGYANSLGSVVSDTGIYFTAGAAAQSWKIVTTAESSFYTPFETPWIDYYNSTLSAITPYMEILRDGSATAYQDDEVWAEFMAKVTAGSTKSTFSSDRMTTLGTPANQAAGAGLGSWTGEGGTAWSGKLGLGASITPAELGHIRARFVVGEPSITVYADPFVRV